MSDVRNTIMDEWGYNTHYCPVWLQEKQLWRSDVMMYIIV